MHAVATCRSTCDAARCSRSSASPAAARRSRRGRSSGCCPRPRRRSGAVILRRHRDVVGLDKKQLRAVRGTEAAMIFQEPSTALNPVYTVGWQIAEGLRAHGKYSQDARPGRSAIEMLGRVGIPDPERARRRLPAPVLGRAEAAHRDRDGARARPDRHRRRRADDRARRHGAGRDPRPAAHAAATSSAPAIVLITHNMGVVADLADRVAVMYEGEIVETAPARELFAVAAARLHRSAARRRAAPRDRRPAARRRVTPIAAEHRRRGRRPRDRVSGPLRAADLPRRGPA